MIEGNLPRFRRPCDVPEGKTLSFSGKDILHWTYSQFGSVHGTIRRDGMRFIYTMSWKQDGEAASMRGIWEYQEKLSPLALTTDLQGWSAYRDNTFVMTVPNGVPQPLEEVLIRLGGSKP